MSVSLVWATPDADAQVAYLARVSAPENQSKTETAPRLISFLIRERHWSPFEMVNICLEIHAPRDIGRQILRHPSIRPQEFSQRYADVRKLGEPYYRTARMQDRKNRQNSIVCEDPDVLDWWAREQQAVWERAVGAYVGALDRGIAKEVARAVLPEGMTPTRMYFNGNLRSWLHFCDVRRGHGTQSETIAIANQVWAVLEEVCPVTTQAWDMAHG